MTAPSRRRSETRRRTAEKPRATRTKPATSARRALRLRTRLQLSQPVFARLAAVSVRSLAALEAGKRPTAALERRLHELDRLIQALSEVIQPNALGQWLQAPNDAFAGLKPLEVIERGESDRLWSMVYYLRSGVPS